MPLGSYRGFAMQLDFEPFGSQYILTLRGEMSHRVELGTDARGNLTRIENALNSIPSRLDSAHAQLENLHNQMEAAKAEVAKPFPQADELKQKSASPCRTGRQPEYGEPLVIRTRNLRRTYGQTFCSQCAECTVQGGKRTAQKHLRGGTMSQKNRSRPIGIKLRFTQQELQLVAEKNGAAWHNQSGSLSAQDGH